MTARNFNTTKRLWVRYHGSTRPGSPGDGVVRRRLRPFLAGVWCPAHAGARLRLAFGGRESAHRHAKASVDGLGYSVERGYSS
jgi:hypothetical protein